MVITSAHGKVTRPARAGSYSSGASCPRTASGPGSNPALPERTSAIMADSPRHRGSVVERTRRRDVQAVVVGVHFLGDTAVFVLGEKTVIRNGGEDWRRMPIHGGGILDSAGDGERSFTER